MLRPLAFCIATVCIALSVGWSAGSSGYILAPGEFWCTARTIVCNLQHFDALNQLKGLMFKMSLVAKKGMCNPFFKWVNNTLTKGVSSAWSSCNRTRWSVEALDGGWLSCAAVCFPPVVFLLSLCYSFWLWVGRTDCGSLVWSLHLCSQLSPWWVMNSNQNRSDTNSCLTRPDQILLFEFGAQGGCHLS